MPRMVFSDELEKKLIELWSKYQSRQQVELCCCQQQTLFPIQVTETQTQQNQGVKTILISVRTATLATLRLFAMEICMNTVLEGVTQTVACTGHCV